MIWFLALVLAQTPQRVMVIHETSGDIDARQVSLYAAHLELEIVKHDGLSLARPMPLETSPAACAHEPSCLAKLADATGAESVLFARTARLGETSVVTMKHLRLSTGEIEQTATRQTDGGTGEDMLVAIGPMVRELFPDHALRPGVNEGVTRDDVMRWSPPPLRPWTFWTSAGATVVSGALIGVFAVQKHNAERDYAAALDAPVADGETLVRDAERAEAASTRTNLLIGVTAGLALTTAIVAYFTDWHSARDSALIERTRGL